MKIESLRKQFKEVSPGVFKVKKGVTIRKCQTCEEFTRFRYNPRIRHSACKRCGNRNIPQDLLDAFSND